MNLLYIFLKYIDFESRQKLLSIPLKGKMKLVWDFALLAIEQDEYGRSKALEKLSLTSAHLDKINSELLSRCLEYLFGEDRVKLMTYLSSSSHLSKVFYAELSTTLKNLEIVGDSAAQAAFVRKCFDLIFFNFSLAFRDSTMIKKLSHKYLSLFKGKALAEATFYIKLQELYDRFDRLFAAQAHRDELMQIGEDLKMIGEAKTEYNPETIYFYYFLTVQVNIALNNYETARDKAQQGILILSAIKNEQVELNIIRLKLKMYESMYVNSQFEEAYNNYKAILFLPVMDEIPSRFYHRTKYTQLCLVTNHLEDAANLLSVSIDRWRAKELDSLIVRDVIALIKYYLLHKDHEEAFGLLQIGFEKNLKASYFQYELELRNLQLSYFILTHQDLVALDLINKGIKYLRNHNYTSTNSQYPHFYQVAKAIINLRKGDTLPTRFLKMYDSQQRSSFAVYGRLLSLMLQR